MNTRNFIMVLSIVAVIFGATISLTTLAPLSYAIQNPEATAVAISNPINSAQEDRGEIATAICDVIESANETTFDICCTLNN